SRQRQSGEVIEIAQIAAGKLRRGRELSEIERMVDGAADDRMGVAGMDVGIEGIRLALIDIEQRPAMNIGEEFVAIERAVAVQDKGVAAARGAFLRTDGAEEFQLAHG